MKKVIVLIVLFIFYNCDKDSNTGTGYTQDVTSVTDTDGNIYSTVRIGTQLWMSDNLNVTHYRNGDAIPNVTNNSDWCDMTTGAYCNCNNDENYATTYGRLYNWHVISDIRGIAPEGWHVPTDAEWQTLVDYYGGWENAGNMLKESGTTNWSVTQTSVTNESGFTALPGGYRSSGNGWFYDEGDIGSFLTSTPNYDNYVWRWQLRSGGPYVERKNVGKFSGHSIRCIKD